MCIVYVYIITYNRCMKKDGKLLHDAATKPEHIKRTSPHPPLEKKERRKETFIVKMFTAKHWKQPTCP